jgi:hypothetical protein
MTGLSTENANLVWQKVAISLDALGANKAMRESFRALKNYLSQEKRNLNLQFVAIDATLVDDANGVVLMDGPCRVFGVFAKKQATGTDTYLALLNDDTDDASPVTDVRLVVGLQESAEQAAVLYPAGIAMSVGVVGKAYTEFDGTTDANSADTPNGFVILGAL